MVRSAVATAGFVVLKAPDLAENQRQEPIFLPRLILDRCQPHATVVFPFDERDEYRSAKQQRTFGQILCGQ